MNLSTQHLSPQRQKQISIGTFAILVIATVWALSQLFYFLWLERHAFTGDADVYMVIARGMLNGLQPYTDLFESKPPGIFFLSLLSLVISSGSALLRWSHLALYALLPPLFAFFVYRRKEKDHLRLDHWLIITLAVLLGTLLALYSHERTLGVQPDAFGAFFGVLYALHILRHDPQDMRPRTILVNAVLLAGAIGMREMFLLTTFAAALIVAHSWQHLLRIFAVPLIVAVALGSLLLLITGLLAGYLNIYLPAMLFARVYEVSSLPLPLRGLAVKALYLNLTAYSSLSLFGALMLLLWLLTPLQKLTASRFASLRLAALFLLIGLALFHFGRTYIGTSLVFSPLAIFFNWTASVQFVLYCITLAGFLYGLWYAFRQHPPVVFTVLSGLGALYLTSLAAGAGGNYAPPHLVSGLPVYAALAGAMLMQIRQQKHVMLTAAIAVAATGTAFSFSPSAKFLKLIADFTPVSQASSAGTQIDLLLLSCGVDRYASLPLGSYHELTMHSPIGPLLNNANARYLNVEHPLFLATFVNILKADMLILADGRSDLSGVELSRYIEAQFTREAPACAAGAVIDEGSAEVWFRRQFVDQRI